MIIMVQVITLKFRIIIVIITLIISIIIIGSHYNNLTVVGYSMVLNRLHNKIILKFERKEMKMKTIILIREKKWKKKYKELNKLYFYN